MGKTKTNADYGIIVSLHAPTLEEEDVRSIASITAKWIYQQMLNKQQPSSFVSEGKDGDPCVHDSSGSN